MRDLATLTDAEARQFAGRPASYRVVLDSEPDERDEYKWWAYDCAGEGEPLRSLWLPDGDDVAAYVAQQGSGVLVVEAPLRRIVHPPSRGGDGRPLPALVEYRLV